MPGAGAGRQRGSAPTRRRRRPPLPAASRAPAPPPLYTRGLAGEALRAPIGAASSHSQRSASRGRGAGGAAPTPRRSPGFIAPRPAFGSSGVVCTHARSTPGGCFLGAACIARGWAAPSPAPSSEQRRQDVPKTPPTPTGLRSRRVQPHKRPGFQCFGCSRGAKLSKSASLRDTWRCLFSDARTRGPGCPHSLRKEGLSPPLTVRQGQAAQVTLLGLGGDGYTPDLQSSVRKGISCFAIAADVPAFGDLPR